MNPIKTVVVMMLVVFFIAPLSLALEKNEEDNTNIDSWDAPETVPSMDENAMVNDIGLVVDEVGGKDALNPILEAVKTEIQKRSKLSGKLDIFDAKIDHVRNLELIALKNDVTQEGDFTVVHGDFRDVGTGDIVGLDIKVLPNGDAYEVKEITIAGIQEMKTAKEVKENYTDEEVQSFMKEYIDVQAQSTGTFDLYDEKTQAMRSLELVNLNPAVRRYGTIAISTAEFKDKNSADKVMVDVNTQNKEGLTVTAMRIKSVVKGVTEIK